MSASRHTYGVFMKVIDTTDDGNECDALCWSLDDASRPACYGSEQAAEDMAARFRHSFSGAKYSVIQLR